MVLAGAPIGDKCVDKLWEVILFMVVCGEGGGGGGGVSKVNVVRSLSCFVKHTNTM